MSFDPTKPVQTRDGREAGIYADNGGDKELHGWFIGINGGRHICCWDESGSRFGQGHELPSDLVNVPDYPPLPDVKGGRWEYRGLAWSSNGEKSRYMCYAEGDRSWADETIEPFIARGFEGIHYAEFIPDAPELVPYTVETFPMWAVWVKSKGSKHHHAITSVTTKGVNCAEFPKLSEFNHLLTHGEIAGVDGEWHPAGQEVSK